ncbi:MAG: endonuclease domain-containing protein, partial [Lysobacter sp.]|nr:endonuclease domain-containing protein [Lysobacter sp.]
MLPYEPCLRLPARRLRCRMSAAEQRLWCLLRGKQVLGVQVYRQKPLLGYVADFYAPAARLVIEVDGSQHLTEKGLEADAQRTAALEALGLMVMRFDNLQVLTETTAVMEKIFRVVCERV